MSIIISYYYLYLPTIVYINTKKYIFFRNTFYIFSNTVAVKIVCYKLLQPVLKKMSWMSLFPCVVDFSSAEYAEVCVHMFGLLPTI